ncbi:MAG: hypothetical protein E6K65_13405 [Nitrospirae bacterium]|nr:MAG: hypothetical protein E6K65_13405 [Nitrospirota bacterium]
MKISKSHGTSELKELAVTRVRAGHSARAVAMELRLIEQTLRNRGKVAAAGTLSTSSRSPKPAESALYAIRT